MVARNLKTTTRDVVESIYKAAQSKGAAPDLCRQDLSESVLDGFNFRSDMADENGFSAKLLRTDFRGSVLINCDFSKTDCSSANFRGADLTNANFHAASLYSALMENCILNKADLRYTNLHSTELVEVRLDGSQFDGASFGRTTIAGVDLAVAEGLDMAVHYKPSSIASDTLRMTAKTLANGDESAKRMVIVFLQKAGVADDLIDAFKSWIGRPISFHSLFLSHSSLDKAFARQLYHDLRGSGVDCWFDERQLLPGDILLDSIDRGIRLWDKVLLVCSKHSLDPRTGWWVEQEVARALQKEREARAKTGHRTAVLIPITIDDILFELESPLQATLLQRYVGDFRRWADRSCYVAALEMLVDALKTNRLPPV